jgi:hypothetical protein
MYPSARACQRKRAAARAENAARGHTTPVRCACSSRFSRSSAAAASSVRPLAVGAGAVVEGGRQILTEVNAIDLLGYRPTEKEWWVIELKRGCRGDAAVGQVSRYLRWVDRHLAAKQDRVVGAIVAHTAGARLRYAIESNPKLSLWVWEPNVIVRRVSPGTGPLAS